MWCPPAASSWPLSFLSQSDLSNLDWGQISAFRIGEAACERFHARGNNGAGKMEWRGMTSFFFFFEDGVDVSE